MPRESLFSSATYHAQLTSLILLSDKIILLCFCCNEKGLIYVAICSPTSCQFLLYTKYTKINICSLCDICSAFDTKYTLLINFYNLLVFHLIYYKVLYLNG